jgi:hypothetical protein
MSDNVRMLPCQLTQDEIDTRGRLLARKVADLVDLEEDKKAKAKEFTDQIKGIEEEIVKLSEAVNTGKEKRPIPVSDHDDIRRFCIETIRHDTMDVVESRAMTSEEAEKARNPTLFDERATAHSRDDDPPKDYAAGTPPEVAAHITASVNEQPDPTCTCGSTTPGIHADECPAVGGVSKAPADPPPGTEVTDPAGLLEGKPDGTA